MGRTRALKDPQIRTLGIVDETRKVTLERIDGAPSRRNDERSKIKKPFKTFKGLKYLGGYSDHFPVYIVLKSK